MVHLISNHIKIRKLVKVLQMKTPLDLFPDVEFEANNNEEEDVNESWQSYVPVQNMKHNHVGLFHFSFHQNLLHFVQTLFFYILCYFKIISHISRQNFDSVVFENKGFH